MPDRVVKTTLVIDEHGSVKAVHSVGEESARTEGKLGHLDKSVKGLGKSFGGLKNMVGLGLGALGAGGAVYGIKSLVDSTKELADTTQQFHAVSGIAPQSSLLTVAALKARGINAEMAGKAFGFMTKNLQMAERQWHTYGSAQGKAAEKGKEYQGLLGQQATAFKELGLNVGALSGLSGEQKLQSVVQAFENMPPAMRKAGDAGRLMKQIFGKGGEGLATALEGGALGLTNLTKEAREFFPTLKVHDLEELHEQTARSNLAFEGLKFTLGMQLIPIVIQVDKWFVKVIREIKSGHGTWGEIAKDVEGVARWIGNLWHGFEHIVGPAKAAKIAVGSLVGVFAVSKVAGFVGALGKLTPALSASLAVLSPELLAIAAALAAVYEAYKHAKEIREFFGINETETTWAGPRSSLPGGQKWTKHGLEAAIRGDRAHPDALSRGGGQAELEKELAYMNAHTKVDVHIDGHKVAEAIARNPRAARTQAESTAHYTSKQAARGAH